MTRQSYVLPEKNLVVFWTPKAACTTISTAICAKLLNLPQEEFSSETGGMRGWLRRSDYWKSGADALKLTKEHGYHTIGLIREPYDRLISAYLNKFVRNKSRDLDTLETLEPFARVFYQNVILPRKGHTAESQVPYEGLTFTEFVNAVCERIEARGANEPRLDHHWNTQIPFSFKDAGFKFDELYTLKSADAFFERFGELTDSDIKNNKLNATHYQEASNENLCDVGSLELIKLPSYSKKQFRSPELESMVKKAFEIDYSYLADAK
ncbi:sulfotransferase family 2 domain-containing protein [Actibacterium lipolyticum]|uniref:Sulfotransferase family protein n=1 Tax=Actibacterium lipolyticum TaxID=1524263 RepID=A0A238KUP2_9RHOB|nr:sulfotransferase family 2 domain-containing protein [Actibacterium lipolyticum]SMX45892.1 Sulfotransferase family protein [Actibacterium lipolyticum]